MEMLLVRDYTHHVRELDHLLWESIASSRGSYLDLARTAVAEPAPVVAHVLPRVEPTADEARACLERLDGNRSRAWRELGLPSRYALYRLIKK